MTETTLADTAWSWKYPEGPNLRLWICGVELSVDVPEHDRLEVAQSLARLSMAIHPEGALDDGES